MTRRHTSKGLFGLALLLTTTTGCGQIAIGIYVATQSGGGGGSGSGGSAPPTYIVEVLPGAGPANAATRVRLNLLPGTTAFFDPSAPAQVTVGTTVATGVSVLSATVIQFDAPANPQGNRTGNTTISVRQGGLLLPALAYGYLAQAPTLTGVSPSTGSTAGAEPLELTGSGFVQGCQVWLGSAPASSVVVQAPDRITCSAPAGAAGSVDVVVRHPEPTVAEARLANGFSYVVPPAPPAPSAAALRFAAQPSDTSAGVALSSVTVQLVDSGGNALTAANASVTIALSANPGGATLSGTTTVSTVNGVATFSDLTLDRAGSGYALSASAIGLAAAVSTSFSVAPGAPSMLKIHGQPSDVVAGSTMTPAVVVRVEDGFGNLVPSTAPVTVYIGNPNGATLSGTTTVNAIGGFATFGDLSVDKTHKQYWFRATSPGLLGVNTGYFDVVAGPAASMAFVSGFGPADVAAGSVLTPAVYVGVYDALGNLVADPARTVVIALAANPGGATLAGTTSKTATIGTVVFFADLTMDKVGTGYTFVASSSGLPDVTSVPFAVTPGPLAQIRYPTQPTQVVSGATMAPAVEVELLDAYGNRLTTNDSVSLALRANPGAAALGGTTTVNASAGIATFATLNLDAAGSGYTLRATSGVVSADSASFDVNPGPASEVRFARSGADHAVGGAIPHVIARVTDANGNVILGATDTITVSLSSNPGGATLSGTLAKAAAGGVAAFRDLALDQPGAGYVLTAAAPGLSAATGDPFAALALPEVTSVSVGSGTQSGCVNVSYTVRQASARRVDVVVEFDDDVSGPFSAATQGDDTLGSATSGTQGLPTSAAGQSYVFHWNSTRDLRHVATNNARLRVTPFLEGRPGTSFTLDNVSLRNAVFLGAPATTTAGGGPTAVATGDLNHDGWIDVVVTDPANADVVVLLGSATGWGTPTDYACGSDPQALAIADLDRDGDLDVVVARTSADQVAVLLGAGDGSLGAAVSYGTGTGPVALAVADLDVDGALDVVTTNTTSGDVSVLLGDGSGALGTHVDFAAGTTPRGLRVLDANVDGKLDVLVSLPASDSLALLPGDGAGTLGTSTLLSAGVAPFGIAAADLDRDGNLDLIVANETAQQVSVLEGTGAGAWATPTTLSTTGASPVTVDVVDQNLDGALDLVVANRDADTLTVFLASSPGAFTTATTVGVGTSPQALAFADLDRDGGQDLVVACASSGVTVVPADQPARCGDGAWLVGERTFASGRRLDTGDVNNDGRVDLLFAGLGVHWNAGSGPFAPGVSIHTGHTTVDVQLADVNEDGFLDLLDLASRNPVRIYPGDGAGGVYIPSSVGAFADRFWVEDLNRDGHVDLVGGWGTVGVPVLYGDGTGAFAAQFNLDSRGDTVYPVGVGDLDADGDLDVVATTNTGRLLLIRGRADGSFGTSVDLGSAYVFAEIAVGDLNADGRDDIVLGEANGQVRVWLANTSGGFDVSTYTGYVAEEPAAVVLGDVDQDGVLDVVGSHQKYAEGGHAYFRGAGDGSLEAPVLLGVHAETGDSELVDLNGDRWLDLASGPRITTGTRVLFGSPAGFEQAPGESGYDEPECAVIHDVNRDGRPDLLVTNRTTHDISISLGQGDGTFGTPVRLSVAPGEQPTELVVIDLNRDGLLDLVTCCYGSRSVAVLFGTAPGAWAAATLVSVGGDPTGDGPTALAVVDLNRDGELDLAVTNRDGNSLAVLLATGPGMFGAPSIYAVGLEPFDVAAGDLDHDGDLDLVLGYKRERRLAIRWNDGSGGFLSATEFALSSPAVTVDVADMDRDGNLDIMCSLYGLVFAFGDGAGGFLFKSPATYVYASLTSGVAHLQVHDFNHDGQPDVLATGREGGLDLVLGQPGRELVERQTYVIPFDPPSPRILHPPTAFGDLDGDGLLDAISVSRSAGRITVLLAR